MRQAIIFEDDRFFHLFKNPIETAGHSPLAAQVTFSKIGQHFAGPVDLVNNGAGSQTCLSFAWAIEARAVSYDE